MPQATPTVPEPFQPEHTGLFFDAESIAIAQAQRAENALVQAAWAWLDAAPGAIVREGHTQLKDEVAQAIRKPTLTPLAGVLVDGLRYRFLNDMAGGSRAVAALREGVGLGQHDTLQAALLEAVAAAQAHEMLHDHPDMGDFAADWRRTYAERTQEMLSAEAEAGFVDGLWLMLLRIVSGVMLEDITLFQSGVDQFRQTVDTQIHVEGYLRFVEKQKSNASFRQMLLGVAALSLAAEAATRAGVDLWRYESRGVSVSTAIAYVVYYYFFPDKWRWPEASALTAEVVYGLFSQYGAFVGIAHYRTAPRFTDNLLDELAPLFSESCGGLTTLTHPGSAPAPARKKFLGLF